MTCNMRLFDSIAHPTINGTWFNKPGKNTFEDLTASYKQHHITGACAVSLPFISIEELAAYYTKATLQNGFTFYPVAAINFDEPDIEKKITALKEIGYTAVKIHTRLSKVDFDKDFHKLEAVFKLCEKHQLIIFFCTYYHNSIQYTPLYPLTHYIIRLLKNAPSVKIILLHGGDVNLMQFAQLARFNANILIDLSYTFMKFKDSSLSQDIYYLMNHLDKKICFGSDYPEFSIAEFRKEMDLLSEKAKDAEKIQNFRFSNITNFLTLT